MPNLLPVFPTDLLPPRWGEWVATTARRLGAPADYVACGLLAAVAGVTGAGVVAEHSLPGRPSRPSHGSKVTLRAGPRVP